MNKLMITFLGVNIIFLLSGGLLLAFALLSKRQLSRPPTTTTIAQTLLLGECPLTAAFFNALLTFTTFLTSLPALLLPSNRSWLRAHGWLVLCSGIFTLALGLFIWLDTLKTRAHLGAVWAAQTPVVQSLLQQKFACCGYADASSPPFLRDGTCVDARVAGLKAGCVGPFSNFANAFLDVVFTAAFGIVGVDVILLLCTAMVLKHRQELERYRHIDEKNGLDGF